jgi:hypothetical protein
MSDASMTARVDEAAFVPKDLDLNNIPDFETHRHRKHLNYAGVRSEGGVIARPSHEIAGAQPRMFGAVQMISVHLLQISCSVDC